MIKSIVLFVNNILVIINGSNILKNIKEQTKLLLKKNIKEFNK